MEYKKTTLPTEYQYLKEDGDGYKYRIPRVPVWATHERELVDPKTGKKLKITVDSNQLRKYAEKHNKRFEEDRYRGPIHEVHNGEKGVVVSDENSGYLGRAYVEPAIFEGKKRDVLFMDYLVDSEEKLDRIKKNPYRSVEVSPRGEISSLAIMKRKAPFFKFPMFKLVENTEGMDANYNEEEFIFQNVAIGYGEESCLVLYKDSAPFVEAPKRMGAMEKQKDKEKDDYMDKKADKEEKKPEMDMDKYMAKYMDSEKGQKCLEKYMDKYMAKMMEEDEDEGDRVKPPAALVDEKPKKGKMNYSEQTLEMMGELHGLREQVAELKAKNELQETVAWALAETQDISRGDDEHFSETIHSVYSETGPDGVKVYIRGLKSGAPKLSEKSDGEKNGSFSSVQEMPECVAKYRENNVKYEAAAKAYTEFNTKLSPSLRAGLTPEQYVDAAVAETIGY